MLNGWEGSLRSSVFGIAAATLICVSPVVVAQDWSPDPAVQSSLDAGAAEIAETLRGIEGKGADILSAEDLATVNDIAAQLEGMWSRHLEYDIAAVTAAEDLAQRILTNHRTGIATSEFHDRSAVHAAVGFSFEDLSGWWSYPDLDYENGCQDEDGQYRAALGRVLRVDGRLQFGDGELTFGMYDGGCLLSNERVEGGNIVLDATCSAEGEDYTGPLTVEVMDADEILVTAPIAKPTRLKACEGTLGASLPVPAAVSTGTASGIDEITPYFAVYLVARQCHAKGYAFSDQDFANLDEVMKTISDGSSATRREKEAMWSTMTGQLGSQRVTEAECIELRQQMMYMFPSGTLVGTGEAFPF
jgi:hypothetical protein